MSNSAYDKVKHLEMIQAVVTRMATNSFLLKGWSVTLIAALFALAAKETNERYAILAFFPGLAFWALDGYYLHQERLFRALYDDARATGFADDPYTMNVESYNKKGHYLSALSSKTVAGAHVFILAMVLAVVLLAAKVV